MRIGTWNLAGRWREAHEQFIAQQGCDLWLFTELSERPEGRAGCRSARMGRLQKSWSAISARSPLDAVSCPHPVTAVATWGELLVCSIVLPWRGARPYWPFAGTDMASWTQAVLDALQPLIDSHGGPVIVGGDFNHTLLKPERAGSAGGRDAIKAFLEKNALTAPTVELGHRKPALTSIDHVAIPKGWTAKARHVAVEPRLSDHDAYIVEVVRAPG